MLLVLFSPLLKGPVFLSSSVCKANHPSMLLFKYQADKNQMHPIQVNVKSPIMRMRLFRLLVGVNWRHCYKIRVEEDMRRGYWQDEAM